MTELNWPDLWDEDEQRYRVKTRDGREARVYTRQGCNPLWPVVGEIQDNGSVGKWRCVGWTADGRYHQSGDASRSPFDLIPEPRTVRRWMNIARVDSKYHFIGPFAAEATARIAQEKNPVPGYIDTAPVEWKE